MEARRAATMSAAVLVLAVASAAWLQPWRALSALHSAAAGSTPPAVTVLGAGFAGREAWIAYRPPAGAGARMLVTVDAGRSWTSHRLPFGAADPPTAARRDGQGPIVVTSARSAYLTPDLGSHWVPVALPPAADTAFTLTFLDANTGWYSGSSVWATLDGGAHWSELPGVPGAIVRFENPLQGWAVDADRLYSTGDGGTTWTLAVARLGLLPAVSRFHDGPGCASLFFDVAANLLSAFISPDCQSWPRRPVALIGAWERDSGADFLDREHWLLGDRGALLATDDGGASWRRTDLRSIQPGEFLQYVGRFAADWWALADASSGAGGGQLFHSADGLHWSQVAVPGLA